VIALGALWFGYQLLFEALLALITGGDPIAYTAPAMDAFFYGSTASGTQLQLAAFAVYLALLAAHMRLLHGLPLRRLIGPAPLALRQFVRVSLFVLPVYALLTFWSFADDEIIQQMALGTWLASLLVTLPLLFVQISAEEFVFRGYLQSQLAALARHPIVWMGVPSLLFGLIHYDPTSPPYTAWAYVVWASFLGLAASDLTARSGTLGPALALHFVNNTFAIVVLAADDWLYGAALYVWPTYGQPWEPALLFEALALFIFWLSARLAIRR
jgi:membrane protease YdiL (CAAX protease family)